MTGSVSYHAGLSAEHCVERAYQLRGHPVLERRWRGQAGEIDLIVQDGAGVIFVEVKKSRSHSAASGRVSANQMQRIMASATDYVGHLPNGQLTDMRFDVATVDGQGAVQIIENAFAHF